MNLGSLAERIAQTHIVLAEVDAEQLNAAITVSR